VVGKHDVGEPEREAIYQQQRAATGVRCNRLWQGEGSFYRLPVAGSALAVAVDALLPFQIIL